MRKKRAKRKRKEKLIVGTTLLFIVSVVAFLTLYRSNPEKVPAEEYFAISENDIEPFGFTHENRTVLELLSLTFKLTAVGGDAHSIVISAGVYANEMIEIINQGESREVYLAFSPRYFSTRLEEEGFLVEISISSTEAKGELKIHIPPEAVPPRD